MRGVAESGTGYVDLARISQMVRPTRLKKQGAEEGDDVLLVQRLLILPYVSPSTVSHRCWWRVVNSQHTKLSAETGARQDRKFGREDHEITATFHTGLGKVIDRTCEI
jgi:hypothetical protein